MQDNSFLCSTPYVEGKTLTLNVVEDVLSNNGTIKLQILRSIQPSTLSCVMEVDVVAGSTQFAKHSILKLYDWRYATELRHDYELGQWTPYHEDTYRTFVEEGGAAAFIAGLEHDGIDDQLWDTARDETFLFDYCRDLHSCEVEAYSRLQDLQGKSVPRFLADVRLDIILPTHDAFFQVRGILLELITGYRLEDLTKYAHQSSWQHICDETIRAINLVSDHGILNEDVRPRNVLIRTHDHVSESAGVIIDFAQCRFRELGQSEAAWKHEKWRQDEGAIGYVMAHKLKGPFTYRPSYRFLCACTKCTEP